MTGPTTQDTLFVSLIHVADLLAKAWQIGSTEEYDVDEDEIPTDTLLNLDAGQIETVFQAAPAEFEETAQACTA